MQSVVSFVKRHFAYIFCIVVIYMNFREYKPIGYFCISFCFVIGYIALAYTEYAYMLDNCECIYCGSEIREDTNYCSQCGKRLRIKLITYNGEHYD